MIDTDIETQIAHIPTQVSNPITFSFALARLQQATIDCAYIFFDQSEPFIKGQHRKKYESRMQIVQEERDKMLNWLNSDDFHATCELVGQDSDIMCSALKKVMNIQDNAMKITREYGLRIAKRVSVIAFLVIFTMSCQSSYCQPFKPLQSLVPELDENIPEIASFEKITLNSIPVKVNGRLKVLYFPVYTYKMKNGKKCDLPVLIKGIADENYYLPLAKGK